MRQNDVKAPSRSNVLNRVPAAPPLLGSPAPSSAVQTPLLPVQAHFGHRFRDLALTSEQAAQRHAASPAEAIQEEESVQRQVASDRTPPAILALPPACAAPVRQLKPGDASYAPTVGRAMQPNFRNAHVASPFDLSTAIAMAANRATEVSTIIALSSEDAKAEIEEALENYPNDIETVATLQFTSFSPYRLIEIRMNQDNGYIRARMITGQLLLEMGYNNGYFSIHHFHGFTNGIVLKQTEGPHGNVPPFA